MTFSNKRTCFGVSLTTILSIAGVPGQQQQQQQQQDVCVCAQLCNLARTKTQNERTNKAEEKRRGEERRGEERRESESNLLPLSLSGDLSRYFLKHILTL